MNSENNNLLESGRLLRALSSVEGPSGGKLKLSLLLASLSSVDDLKKFEKAIKVEVLDHSALLKKRGASVPIHLIEDCSGEIGPAELGVLLDAGLSGELSEESFSYIIDALSLSQKVKFTFPEIKENVLDLADNVGRKDLIVAVRDKLVEFMKKMSIFILLMISCSSNKENQSDAFTFETGVSVIKSVECEEEGKGGGVIPERKLEVSKKGNDYFVNIANSFPCQAHMAPPYLTAEIDGKSSLVLLTDRGTFGFRRNCDCSREIELKISNRIKAGEVVYVLSDYRALGHFIAP